VDKYLFKYEPLYVARADTPPFDERFIGFGMTRNTQVKRIYRLKPVPKGRSHRNLRTRR
jgi:hypothetical protein